MAESSAPVVISVVVVVLLQCVRVEAVDLRQFAELGLRGFIDLGLAVVLHLRHDILVNLISMVDFFDVFEVLVGLLLLD